MKIKNILSTMALFPALFAATAHAAGPGSGTHGGKMVMCFYLDSAKTVPDLTIRNEYFTCLKPDSANPGQCLYDDYGFRNDQASPRATTREAVEKLIDDKKVTATLLDLFPLTNAVTSRNENIWADHTVYPTTTAALQEMYKEFQRVPKFYRLLKSAAARLPLLGENDSNLDPNGIPDVDDAAETSRFADNCVAVQAAERQQGTAILDYDSLVWKAASDTPEQQAALQLHEDIYFLGAESFGHINSKATQELIKTLAKGGTSRNWSDLTCELAPVRPTSFDQDWEDQRRSCARADELSDLLGGSLPANWRQNSENPADLSIGDFFGYYPTLNALNALRNAIHDNITELHGAFQTVGVFCEAAKNGRDFKKVVAQKIQYGMQAVRAAHLSLQGITQDILSIDKTRAEIQKLIDAQNSRFPKAPYKVIKGQEDPEVLVAELAEDLIEVSKMVRSEMICDPTVSRSCDPNSSTDGVRDPNSFFDNRSGTDNYCRAMSDAEASLAEISQQLATLRWL